MEAVKLESFVVLDLTNAEIYTYAYMTAAVEKRDRIQDRITRTMV